MVQHITRLSSETRIYSWIQKFELQLSLLPQSRLCDSKQVGKTRRTWTQLKKNAYGCNTSTLCTDFLYSHHTSHFPAPDTKMQPHTVVITVWLATAAAVSFFGFSTATLMFVYARAGGFAQLACRWSAGGNRPERTTHTPTHTHTRTLFFFPSSRTRRSSHEVSLTVCCQL